LRWVITPIECVNAPNVSTLELRFAAIGEDFLKHCREGFVIAAAICKLARYYYESRVYRFDCIVSSLPVGS
jgi:hypothetical protein